MKHLHSMCIVLPVRLVTLLLLSICMFSLANAQSSQRTVGKPTLPNASPSDRPTAARLQAEYKSRLAALFDKVRQKKTARVIVQVRVLSVPKGPLTAAEVENRQMAEIATVQTAVVGRLVSRFRIGEKTVRRSKYIPFFDLAVDEQVLEALRRDPDVVAIEEDRLIYPSLNETVPLIGGASVHDQGFTGEGQVIAILDTGVVTDHPFLAGKLVSEACYSSADYRNHEVSFCTPFFDEPVFEGAGKNCSLSLINCDHGTHVAGIAAGKKGLVITGVAPDARVIAIQVSHGVDDDRCKKKEPSSCQPPGEAPCIQIKSSDVNHALERVYNLNTQKNIAAVNISLVGGKYSSRESCDQAEAATKAIVDKLRFVGIATVAASGNDCYIGAISAPACISSVISVGSTNKQDQLAPKSNVANFLDLLAPGNQVLSSGMAAKAIEDGSGSGCGLNMNMGGTAICWRDFCCTGSPHGKYYTFGEGFKQISVGGQNRVCGVRTNGVVSCWYSYDGSPISESPPNGIFTQVSVVPNEWSTYFGYCGLRSDGIVICWPQSFNSSIYNGGSPPLEWAFKQISTSADAACGVRTDGTISCWPCWESNQQQRTCWPVQDPYGDPIIPIPSGIFKQVSVNYGAACGVRADEVGIDGAVYGAVLCWGANTVGSGHERLVPPSGAFKQVSLGTECACGIRNDDTLECWGKTYTGQSCNDIYRIPSKFIQLSDHIPDSNGSLCGVSNGTPSCWSSHFGLADNDSFPAAAFAGIQQKSGTSIAAPHVAGAWAVLKAAIYQTQNRDASVNEIFDILKLTGKPIRVIEGSLSVPYNKPRIDLKAALDAIKTWPALTVIRSGRGSGTVTSQTGGINCGSYCESLFKPGSRIALIATPGFDSRFAGWSGACAGFFPVCFVSMGANPKVAVATFTSGPTDPRIFVPSQGIK